MHERLVAALGDRTYRHIGELTGTHPETVRRYLQGQSPSIEFVAAVSSALGISAEWLITGRGPMMCEQLKAHALAQAGPAELLEAMSGTMERLIDRVERIEVYVQTLETRVRAQQPNPSEHATPSSSPNGTRSPDPPRSSRGAATPRDTGSTRGSSGGPEATR